jgi:hypothetical protein
MDIRLGTGRIDRTRSDSIHLARRPAIVFCQTARLVGDLDPGRGAAIELESGFTESISARSFIERGEGDAETATRTGLGSWLIQLIRLSTAVVAFVFVNTLTPAVSN